MQRLFAMKWQSTILKTSLSFSDTGFETSYKQNRFTRHARQSLYEPHHHSRHILISKISYIGDNLAIFAY